MNIGVLIFSTPANDAHAQADRLEEAGRMLGHTVTRIHAPLLTITEDGPEPVAFDAIICRPNFIGEPSLHQFVAASYLSRGIRVINGNFVAAKNKLAQHVRLAEAGVAMPRWAIAHTSENLVAAAKEIRFPVICKVAFGTHGTGVFYAADAETLGPIADYLTVHEPQPVIVEKFVDTGFPSCRDLRAFVVGDKVVAAMERVAKDDDVRANASIGGTGHPVELSDAERNAAIAAAKAFDLEIAGVDILRSKNGPVVIEVNANPGFKELERITGVDVAKAIVEYATG